MFRVCLLEGVCLCVFVVWIALKVYHSDIVYLWGTTRRGNPQARTEP